MSRGEFAKLIQMPASNYHNIVNGVYILGDKRFRRILDCVGVKVGLIVEFKGEKIKIDE